MVQILTGWALTSAVAQTCTITRVTSPLTFLAVLLKPALATVNAHWYAELQDFSRALH